MTRFARAKGSKASNERIPEEATSWKEMKRQLLTKQQETNMNQKKAVAEAKRVENYKSFLQEKEEANSKNVKWAEFPGVQKNVVKKIKMQKKLKKTVKNTVSKTSELKRVFQDDDGSDDAEFSMLKEKIDKALAEEGINIDKNASHDSISKPSPNKSMVKQKVLKRPKSNIDDGNMTNVTAETNVPFKKKKVEKTKTAKQNKNVQLKTEQSFTDEEFNNDEDDAPEEVSAKAVPANTVTVVKKKKIKQKPLKIPQIINIQDTKKSIPSGEKILPKKEKVQKNKPAKDIKDKNSKPNKKDETAKPIEGKTKEDLAKIEKKKQKRLRQLEKKKHIKALKAQDAEQGQKPVAKTPPKPRDDKQNPRKKPQNPTSFIINGKEVQVAYFDGFPVKKEDHDRLIQLQREMRTKGLPSSEIKRAMKLERRRAEKNLARERKKLCFNCRQSDHNLSECPKLNQQVEFGTGICFKCGSTEHTHFQCKVVRGDQYKFAQCFICKEQGHISRQCPDNNRGVYPKGGACKVCGDVTHLKKDCPKFQMQQEQQAVIAKTIDSEGIETLEDEGGNKMSVKSKANVTKIVKF